MGQTINKEVYCQQLERLHEEIREKRPEKDKIILLHDNATPHTALITKEKIAQFGWTVMPHPPYSPDLAPTDYKAFQSLQNWLNGKNFETDEEVKASIQNWIDSKTVAFWVKGIAALPGRWTRVIEYEGNYFPEE
jgi:histone-lysine N-methyltransferase SETMAR